MQYRLRTLLIVLAVGPIAGAWGYQAVDEYLRYRQEWRIQELSKIKYLPERLLRIPTHADPD